MRTDEPANISDTPETDEEAWFDNDEGWWVSRSFARRLERGRNCAMAQLALTEKSEDETKQLFATFIADVARRAIRGDTIMGMHEGDDLWDKFQALNTGK